MFRLTGNLGQLPGDHNECRIISSCYDLIQMREPLETVELLAFTKSVESRSLSRAAAELAVPRATLSRRLARLEQRLGARLLRRTTRSLSITDAGEALYRHARIALEAVAEAEATVRRKDETVRGNLRVALPPIVSSPFLDLLAEFAAAYPEVRLQAHLSTRHVDLQRDGYDVALRASGHLEPGLVARTLARFEFIAVASPAYLVAQGTPTSLRDLRDHRCLMGFARGELPETRWTGDGRSIQLEGVFFSNSPAMLVRLAERGLGIAVVPSLAVQSQLQSGALVVVMPGLLRSEGRIALVYPERELVPPPARAFVDWLVARAPAALVPASAASPDRAPGKGKGARRSGVGTRRRSRQEAARAPK
jgi:DNA-binding transcriptional LysR family regulator